MKLRVVSSRKEIETLNPNEKMIHLGFRPSNVDLLKLMQRCPRLRAIQTPPSYYITLSNANLILMNIEGVELLSGDVWGHRKDLDEYFTVDGSTMKEIVALAEGGASPEEIKGQIQEKVRLGPDLIKYIAKNKITV